MNNTKAKQARESLISAVDSEIYSIMAGNKPVAGRVEILKCSLCELQVPAFAALLRGKAAAGDIVSVENDGGMATFVVKY